MRRVLAVWSVALMGCAGASRPEPLFQDASYLRVGARPGAEADALAHSHAKAGLRLVARLDGRTFSAIGLRSASGVSAVRVVTRKGIVLALDGHSEGADTGEVGLAVHSGRHDLDRDGFEEIVVVVDRGGMRCIRIFRVRERGFLQEVPVEAAPLGPDACGVRVIDLDRDGRPEVLARRSLWTLSRGRAPSASVPLLRGESGYVWRPAAALVLRHLGHEQRARAVDLERARRGRQVDDAYRLGVELALLEAWAGASASRQLGRLSRAIAGLPLTPSQQRSFAAARAFIRRGWRAKAGEAGAVEHE